MSLELPKTLATYEPGKGNAIVLYHDASEDAKGEKGAFADIGRAIQEAKHFIFVADWSFQPHMRLKHLTSSSGGHEIETAIGALLLRKAYSDRSMLIAIHTWDHTNSVMPDWQNDYGDVLLGSLAKSLGLSRDVERPGNLLWRASSHVGAGWSHHQKFIVLDAPGKERRLLKVFFGGLDLTKGRFDWHVHPILPSEREASCFLQQIKAAKEDEIFYYDDWYNAEFRDKEKDNRGMVRQPWHDIHAQLVGPAAWDFVREFVGRWNLDPAYPDAQGDDDSKSIQKVQGAFNSLFDRKRFLQQWEPHQGNWEAQVYRSIPRDHWGAKNTVETPDRKGARREFVWRVQSETESSIQEAYIKAINAAERFIYIETQYLIGSGKCWNGQFGGPRKTVCNRIPETIVSRIVARHKEGKPFHVYVVLPMFPEGDPNSSGALAQRRFGWATIAAMVTRLRAQVGDVWKSYLSFYFLARWYAKSKESPMSLSGSRQGLVQKNQRYMIYVHSKMMIMDDRYLILGSANLNERSLAGDRDSEIAVGLWPDPEPKQGEACVKEIQEFRKGLWQEHFGKMPLPAKWQEPESQECIGAVQQAGHQNYINFRLREKPEQSGHLCRWPIEAGGSYGIFFASGQPKLQPLDRFVPDGICSLKEKGSSAWLWIPSSSLVSDIVAKLDLAE